MTPRTPSISPAIAPNLLPRARERGARIPVAAQAKHDAADTGGRPRQSTRAARDERRGASGSGAAADASTVQAACPEPRAEAWARRAALGVIALLPLAAWPGIERPFSTPKLYLLVAAVLLLGPFAWMAQARRRAQAAAATGLQPIRRAARGGSTSDAPASPMRATPADDSLDWPRRVVPPLWLASWSGSALLGDIVSLDALLLALAAGLFALILIALDPDALALAAALAAGSTGVAAVAVAQWLGVDPFALAGWVAPLTGASPRLRIYATLGNPNFVAALLAAAVPVTVGLLLALRAGRAAPPVTLDPPASLASPASLARPASLAGPRARPRTQMRAPMRLLAWRLPLGPRPAPALGLTLGLALALQLCAIAATGSRAGALGLLGAAFTGLVLGTRHLRPRVRAALALLATAGALGLVALSPARPLGDTVDGRLHIWRTVWPHAFEAPVSGRGPGAFELLHPTWEQQSRPPASDPAARFAGPQQHAHNDYLEALVDRGLAGPVTILLVLATSWTGTGRRARRAPVRPVAIGAAAAVVALGVMACVDFPLARPAELVMWWSALALAGSGQKGHS